MGHTMNRDLTQISSASFGRLFAAFRSLGYKTPNFRLLNDLQVSEHVT